MDTIPYFLAFLFLIFSIWIFLKVQKYQHTISKENTFLEIEIENEIKNKAKLMSVSKKISKLENNTHQQFLKIKVAIVNLEFTLQEIL